MHACPIRLGAATLFASFTCSAAAYPQSTVLSGDGLALPVVQRLGEGRSGWTELTTRPGFVVFTAYEAFVGDMNGDGDALDHVPRYFDVETSTLQTIPIHGEFITAGFADGSPFLPLTRRENGDVDWNGDGDMSDFVLEIFDRDAGTIWSAGLAVVSAAAWEGGVIALVTETADGKDWNGDGALSTNDTILALDPASRSISFLGSTSSVRRELKPQQDGRILFLASEMDFNGAPVDLTADGDLRDFVAAVLDPATETIDIIPVPLEGLELAWIGSHALLLVDEKNWSRDLDGDGQLTSEDLLVVYDASTGDVQTTTWLTAPQPYAAIPTATSFGAAFRVSEIGAGDLNGDGDGDDEVVALFFSATGEIRVLDVATNRLSTLNPPLKEVVPGLLAFPALEADEGATDLNSDGDASDEIWALYDTDTKALTLVPFATATLHHPHLVGDAFVFALDAERENTSWGGDLDGDGGDDGHVIHRFDLGTGLLTNLEIEVREGGGIYSNFYNDYPALSGGLLLYVTNESFGDLDLNGDGDTIDQAVVAWDPATESTRSFHISTRAVSEDDRTDARLRAGEPRPFAFGVQEIREGRDLNGDGDLDDWITFLIQAL